MAEDRFKDEEFIGWLKVKLSLIFAKEGVEKFSDDEVEALYNKIKNNIPSSSSPGPHTCDDKKKLIREWAKGQFTCQADHCDKWLGKIRNEYDGSPASVVWENCDRAQLSSDPWTCAKIFLPNGSANYTCASDADIAALLTLFLKCKHFRNFFSSIDVCQKVKDIRNRLSHSGDMKLDASTVQTDVQKILELLEDPKHLLHQQECKDAVIKIKELMSGKTEISQNKELELRVLNTELRNLADVVDALQTKVKDTSVDVASNEETLDKLKDDHKQFNSELEKVKVKSETFNQFITDSKIKGVSMEMLSEVSNKISQIQARLNELTDRVEKLEEQCKTLTQEQIVQKQKLEQVETSISDVSKEQTGQKHKLDELETGISDVSKEQSGQKQKLDRLETDVKKEQGDQRQRLDELETSHIAVSKEQRHLKRAFEEKQIVREMSVEAIQGHLISLYKKHSQTIPIYPLRPKWRKHVASLFVLPSMKVTNPLGLSAQHLMTGLDEGSDTRVTSIQDIFLPADISCMDIYIMGDAGTGKSTLCEYLVHLWVSSHTPSSQTAEADEKFMQQFKFLFFLSLREATSCNIEEMIESQLLLKDVNIARLLYDNTSLIILDGLDEYSLKQTFKTRFSSENLPYRRHYDKCTVLTTSRPWKLEFLAEELEDKIDRQISIVGLDAESQMKLVGKVVDLLNSEKNRDKSPDDFIKEVQAQQLDKFMKTPVLLMQMLGLWFSGESLGGSKCSIYVKLVDKQIQFTEKIKKAASNIQEVQRDNEATRQSLFAEQFKNYPYIMRYEDLLQKVCSFAYYSLSRKDKENSLIFSHEQMELFDMSSEEITLCLHLGLLTQYKVFGEITEREKYLSFLHKSHQEFFGAMYISQIDQAGELGQLLERDFTNLSQILEMGTVFMFVCGMNPAVARDISRFIMDKASEDDRLKPYQQFDEYWFSTDPKTALMKQLQGLILAGIEEGRKNDHQIPNMQLHYLYMNVLDQDFPPARVLACTGSLDLPHVKSLYIRDQGAISRDVLRQLLQSISKSLHKLVLWDTKVSVEMIQRVVQHQQARLQTLALMNRNVDSFDFSHLNQTDLQNILSAPTNSLSLHGIVLTHPQLEFLYQHVSNSCYGQVRLGKLQCTTHPRLSAKPCLTPSGVRHGIALSHQHDVGNECNRRLDLSANRNLSMLALIQLPVQEVLFVPDNLVECMIIYLPEPVSTSIISCLKRAEKLERFYCFGLRGSTITELAVTLTHLQHLKYIGLAYINLSGQQQVIRAMAQLKKVEVIGLLSVTMREEELNELNELLAALPYSRRVQVELGHSSGMSPVTITGYNMQTDLLKQIRLNTRMHVIKDEVAFEGDKCIVKHFGFYTKSHETCGHVDS